MKWSDLPHWVRCLHLMQGLRGNWSEARDSDMLRLLYIALEAAREEGLADTNWLAAVRANADTFDGHFNDGRIFRDGHRLLPTATAVALGLPPTEGDPDGYVSASGNVAAMMGAKRVKQGDWYGNYSERPSNTEPSVLDGPCPASDCMEHDA